MLNLSLGKKGKIPDYFKESQMIYGVVAFDPKLCNGCGICVSICPARGLMLAKRTDDSKKKLPMLIETAPGISLCMACGDCSAACPEAAIRIKRGFNAGFFFHKISQQTELTLPKKY
ncbi:MAG: 4Fe-4S dicluster domain-containing protein [Smithella sp.]|jgi:ferredoxin